MMNTSGDMTDKDVARIVVRCLVVVGLLILALVPAGMYGCPKYNVWEQGLSGQAALKRAEQTRKIAIEAAKAEEESAQFRANAIQILGKAAKEFPEYRRQEFIGAFAEALQNGHIEQIIYVPTESTIPIMEAGRRGRYK